MIQLDTDYVRAQFPAFSEPGMTGFAHLENAGGSWACGTAQERLARFYRRTKLQPYYPSVPSSTAGKAMDESRTRLSAWLGIAEDELSFGPSTTANTYVLSQAMRHWLKPGDEVVVTNQDHEANIGAFRRLAEEGFTVREWKMNPETAELDEAGLEAVLNDRTRVVAFTQCSNIVGSINPVRSWCERIRDAGAVSIVDGVSYAPHGLPQVPGLGADVYLFSMYKVYGPHLGVMTMRPSLNERLPSQAHFFNESSPPARFTPAGQDHAQVAAVAGVLDYFEDVDTHHFPDADKAGAPERVHQLFRDQEKRLARQLLDFVVAHPRAHLIGRQDAEGRAPTISFKTEGIAPEAISQALAQRDIGVAWGNFYAWRCLDALGIDPETGVLRCSMVHYNTPEEVARLVEALDDLL